MNLKSSANFLLASLLILIVVFLLVCIVVQTFQTSLESHLHTDNLRRLGEPMTPPGHACRWFEREAPQRPLIEPLRTRPKW